MYCALCNHENRKYGQEKQTRFLNAVMAQHNSKIARRLRDIGACFGVIIHLNGRCVWMTGSLKESITSICSVIPASLLSISSFSSLVPTSQSSSGSPVSMDGVSLCRDGISTEDGTTSTFITVILSPQSSAVQMAAVLGLRLLMKLELKRQSLQLVPGFNILQLSRSIRVSGVECSD